MKKQTLRSLVYLGLFFILSGFAALTTATDKDKTFNVSKGDKLEVGVSNGNITISTWDKDQVYVKAVNVDEDDLKYLKIEQQGNKVVVEFKGKDSDDFYLEVSVPSQFNLDMACGGGNISLKGNMTGKVDLATGGGNISTKNITGRVEISTGGGNIKLEDVTGKLEVSTGGGDVSIGMANDITEISTGGGNVTIASAKQKLEVSTGGGNISIGNIGGSCEISTGGGNISIGKVAGGVEISTGGGNIKLDGSNGKVDVSTGGGNIILKNIKGSIDVSSGSGDIEVDFDPQSGSISEISTGTGNITLYISENAKTTIKANFLTGKYSGNDKDFKVHLKSDFDGVTYDINENKREMNAVLKLNGGGSTIELNVTSGEIFIKKK